MSPCPRLGFQLGNVAVLRGPPSHPGPAVAEPCLGKEAEEPHVGVRHLPCFVNMFIHVTKTVLNCQQQMFCSWLELIQKAVLESEGRQ